MKFLLYILIFINFALVSNKIFAAECSAEPISDPTDCYRVPDLYQITLHELGFCNNLSPTRSSLPDISSNCHTTYNNSSGFQVAVENNSSSAISGGNPSRPPNSTYNYGYIKVDARVILKSSHTFLADQTGSNSGTGKTCWTNGNNATQNTVDCGSAESANPQNMEVDIVGLNCQTTPLGAQFYCQYENDAEGLDNTYAWLVDADGNISTSSNYSENSGDVKYLIGVATYNSPLIVNDSTQGGEAQFRVTRGLRIITNGDGKINYNIQEFKVLTSVY